MAKFGPIDSPMEEIFGNPNDHMGGPGEYDGEEGYPKRTKGDAMLPEKFYDECGEFGKAGKDEA